MLSAKFLDQSDDKIGVLGASVGTWPDVQNYEIYCINWSSCQLITLNWSPGNWIHSEMLNMDYVPQNVVECVSIVGDRAVYLDGARNCLLNLRTGSVQELSLHGGPSAFTPDGRWLLMEQEGGLIAQTFEHENPKEALKLGAMELVCSNIEGVNDIYVTHLMEDSSFNVVVAVQGYFKILLLTQTSGGAPVLSAEVICSPHFDSSFHRVFSSGICASLQTHSPPLFGSKVFTIDEMFKTVSTLDLETGKADALTIDSVLSDASKDPFNRITKSVSCIDSSASLIRLRNGDLVHWEPDKSLKFFPRLDGEILLWTPERLLCTREGAKQLCDVPLADLALD